MPSTLTYNHNGTQLPFVLSKNNRVAIVKKDYSPENYLTEICHLALDIAELIGIECEYSTPTTNAEVLTTELPQFSHIADVVVYGLRGWNYFQSCVKGFNSLGLIAEQVNIVLKAYENDSKLKEHDWEKFISTRIEFERAIKSGNLIEYSNRLKKRSNSSSDVLCLAIWKTFAERPIICSTSSNMGISLHECLRAFQVKQISHNDKVFSLLRPDEGKLIIWCPDREADFMNNEKSDMLESLCAELPNTTILRTYINRQQRDPGALSDALESGGYFFPTNPQSEEEVQNLLFVGLKELAQKRNKKVEELLTEVNVQELLNSLGATVNENVVVVTRGVQGGIAGLMIPYLIMIEEHVKRNCKQKNMPSVSTWNQASIGAALAAAVLADKILRNKNILTQSNIELFNRRFSHISQYWPKISSLLKKSKVHGLFDLANIQSLAQLLGVTVLRHTSGRGTAFVGLGSSSYSNGNSCFNILNDSSKESLSFWGAKTFHPATHTLNYVAQAITYGEGLSLYKSGRISDLSSYKKPEPAGAAALAGFLLYMLDNNLMSIYEIAFLLKCFGFDRSKFLQFCNYNPSQEDNDSFVQLAFEEGPSMGNFAANLLNLLDEDHEELAVNLKSQRVISTENKLKHSSDSSNNWAVIDKNYEYYIYLTGDNTIQPNASLKSKLAESSNLAYLEEVIQATLEDKASRFSLLNILKTNRKK